MTLQGEGLNGREWRERRRVGNKLAVLAVGKHLHHLRGRVGGGGGDLRREGLVGWLGVGGGGAEVGTGGRRVRRRGGEDGGDVS